jgi:hypothetical protein
VVQPVVEATSRATISSKGFAVNAREALREHIIFTPKMMCVYYHDLRDPKGRQDRPTFSQLQDERGK